MLGIFWGIKFQGLQYEAPLDPPCHWYCEYPLRKTAGQVKLRFDNVGFSGESKPGNPAKNPLSAGKNLQKTQPTFGGEQ